jgi:viologen exporter family transport system permease protein
MAQRRETLFRSGGVTMNTLKLLSAFLKVNIQMSLAYRADTVVNILLNLMWLGWELLSLSIIFSNTDTIGGWDFGELIALLGVFRLVHTLMIALIWPNTEKFNQSIRDGSMDYTLLQPINSMFLVTFSRITVWRAWDLILATVLIVIGINMSGETTTLLHILTFILLTVSGAIVIYSLWIVLIALTFWFTKFDNNVTILQALLDAGRYPVTVYPVWLRIIVTFIIPVAVATTVPLQALRGELSIVRVLMFIAIGIVSFLIASRVWKAGLKQYSGASS